jgi:hypothetical protein
VDQWIGETSPIDWDRISTIKLTQKQIKHGLNECKRGTAKGKAIIINNIDRFVLVQRGIN